MADTEPIGAVTHRRVLGAAIPIVLSNATVPILGLVDTGVVGQLGEAAPITAVGVGAIILSAIYWVFGFLRMGTVGLTSQAAGAGDTAEVAALLTRALIVAGAAGTALIVLQWPLFAGAFLVSPASREVEDLASGYMAIRIWSAPAAIAVYGITGWLIAQERTRAVLVIQVWMNGLNMLLDIIFVLGLDWGVNGVAFATFLAEWSGALLGLWFCRSAFAVPAWRDWTRVFDRGRLTHMARVNTDILIRSVLLQAIFVSFTLWGAGFGDVEGAANQILLQFLFVTAYALDGFAFAAEALVGQAMGSRRPRVLRRAALLSSFWGGLICCGLSVVFLLFGPWAITVLAKSTEVQQAAQGYLIWMVIAPPLGVAAWMLDGIFIGATRSRDMRNMMAISAVIYFAATYPLTAAFDNHGLWMALLLSFVVRGISLGSRYPALERAAAMPA